MKTVFSNYECVHVWAQQEQNEGRTPKSSLYFEGATIYSYGRHYPLATYLTPSVVLINDSGYSATTGKHISLVIGATSHKTQYFTSECDWSQVRGEIKWNFDKLATARKPEKYISKIKSLWASFLSFREWLRGSGLNCDTILFNPLLGGVNNIGSPEHSSLEDSSAYKELKHSIEALENSKAVEEWVKAERQKANEKRAEKLRAFMEYETNYINKTNSSQVDFIRISEDRENVETSQGVKVPVRDAGTLYSLIKAGKDIKGHRIGYYTVTSLNGTLKIGCHSINRKNMNEVGEAVLGLLN